jgi:membrane fusion protein, multidrug efflux system
MKVKRSRLIVTAIILLAIVAAVFKLKSNRKQINDELAIVQRSVEKIPVSVDTVNQGIISKNVIVPGVLEASQVLNLVSETQGKIIAKYKQKGDKVNIGDVIVKVDDEVISANVITAEANYEQNEKDIDRLTRLSKEDAVSKHDLEQATIGLKKSKADLINARKALSNTSIKAPISGYINNESTTIGQFLGGGSPVCEIVNNSILKLNIKVTENEIFKITIGQVVPVEITALPDIKFTGKITSIAEKADAAMKFNVEITLINDTKAHLKSGLYAEVELPIENKDKLIINKAAILGSMEMPVVYIVENGKAVKRSLVIGQSNDTQVEVLSGISKGDLIIVSGQLNLKDGDEVKIVD